MADAWGRLTGQPGVALVTGGQGHSNAVAALYNALASESPLVLLSGHAPLRELGRGAFQEMAQADLARPVSKASWTAQGTAALGEDIAKAFELASTGRPGPVHISLPVDLLEQTISDDQIVRMTKPHSYGSPLSPGVVDNVIAQLHAAAAVDVAIGFTALYLLYLAAARLARGRASWLGLAVVLAVAVLAQAISLLGPYALSGDVPSTVPFVSPCSISRTASR